MARDATTCLEIEEKITPLGVAGAVEGDRASGALCHGVGGSVFIEHVNVGTKLETKVVKIDGACSSNDGEGAHGGGDADGGGEHVAGANGENDEFGHHEARHPFEREAVGDGTTVRFDGADGALDDVDVIVSGNWVKSDRDDIFLDAAKYPVSLQLVDFKATAE